MCFKQWEEPRECYGCYVFVGYSHSRIVRCEEAEALERRCPSPAKFEIKTLYRPVGRIYQHFCDECFDMLDPARQAKSERFSNLTIPIYQPEDEMRRRDRPRFRKLVRRMKGIGFDSKEGAHNTTVLADNAVADTAQEFGFDIGHTMFAVGGVNVFDESGSSDIVATEQR